MMPLDEKHFTMNFVTLGVLAFKLLGMLLPSVFDEMNRPVFVIDILVSEG